MASEATPVSQRQTASSPERRAPKVFISYAHDSERHKKQVREFGEFLRTSGIDADLDQLFPPRRQDWYAWAIERITAWADFVIIIGSEAYHRVGDGIAQSDDHPGAQTEAGILRDLLYEDRQSWTPRILPVVLPGHSVNELPHFVLRRTADHYIVKSFTKDDAQDLLDALLAGQPSYRRTRPALSLPHRGGPGHGRNRYGTGVAALEEAAEELARKVELRWRTDEIRREILSPTLPLRWAVTATAEAAMAGVTWESIQVTARENLDGQFGDIASLFTQQLPRHRLAILGESGAGKSALATRLVRDLASERVAGGLVPVLFDATTWDPDRHGLTGWMALELARNFDGLTRKMPFASARRSTLAEALVTNGRILPVIDGLDAIATGSRHRAIAELNSHDLPLVVTSQPDPYHQAITERGRGLARTAVVELLPFTHDELPKHLEPLGDAGWQRMLGCLRDDPHGPLAQALRTPLMIWLLRTMYRRPTADASVLCDRNRLPDRSTIEDHLLAGFIPAAYDDRPPPAARRRTDDRWLSEDAHRWLSFLARHVRDQARQARDQGGPDICWWRLHRSVPALESLLGVVGIFAFAFALGTVVSTRYGIALGVVTAVIRASPHALKVIGARFTDQPRRVGPSPRRVRWTIFEVIRGVLFGTIPLLVGFWLLQLEEYGAVPPIVGAVLITAALTRLARQAARAKRTWNPKRDLVIPTDLPKAASPRAALRADRRTALLLPAITLLPLATLASLAFRHPLPAIIAAGFSLAWILHSAYGKFTVARWLLAMRGLLPLRTMSFLDDAVERGVLRQVGATYQLRHARLLDQLAARKDP